MVTNLSSGFAAAPPGRVVPGSVTRIWQDDWERISLILEPPRPITRKSNWRVAKRMRRINLLAPTRALGINICCVCMPGGGGAFELGGGPRDCDCL